MNEEAMIFAAIYFGLVFVLIWINYDVEVKYPGKTIELTLSLDKIIQKWGIMCGLTILFMGYVIVYFVVINLPLINLPLLEKQLKGFVVGVYFL